MKTITKLMMTRTVFDSDVPRIQNMRATIENILQMDSPKVRIHPLDGRRVMHALRYVDLIHLNEVLLRSNL
jgi:hypothetical protein